MAGRATGGVGGGERERDAFTCRAGAGLAGTPVHCRHARSWPCRDSAPSRWPGALPVWCLERHKPTCLYLSVSCPTLWWLWFMPACLQGFPCSTVFHQLVPPETHRAQQQLTQLCCPTCCSSFLSLSLFLFLSPPLVPLLQPTPLCTIICPPLTVSAAVRSFVPSV